MHSFPTLYRWAILVRCRQKLHLKLTVPLRIILICGSLDNTWRKKDNSSKKNILVDNVYEIYLIEVYYNRVASGL